MQFTSMHNNLSNLVCNDLAGAESMWRPVANSEWRLLSVSIYIQKEIIVDREIFTLKIICLKIFHVVKFSRFHSIREIFLTVDYCNMDERLESSWRLVYYQVSGEPGIAHCSCRSDIYPMECGLARKLIHWSSPCTFLFRVFNFLGWSRPRNYFNSEIFPICGMWGSQWSDHSIGVSRAQEAGIQ